MPKGDIVLITFPFTDLSGTKLRPSVVLAETNQAVTVAFITTQLGWREAIDLFLTPDLINGLKNLRLCGYPSLLHWTNS